MSGSKLLEPVEMQLLTLIGSMLLRFTLGLRICCPRRVYRNNDTAVYYRIHETRVQMRLLRLLVLNAVFGHIG